MKKRNTCFQEEKYKCIIILPFVHCKIKSNLKELFRLNMLLHRKSRF